MASAKKSICASITDHVQFSGFRDGVEIHGKARGLKGQVKISRPDTIIETRDIIDNIPLNEPFSRVLAGDLREISEKLDMGVNILADHTCLFHGIDNKLGDMGNTLNSMDEKFDTLPERIAEAMKK